jgi:lipoprotein-anchoring transpeptidase ErfK/SrfK
MKRVGGHRTSAAGWLWRIAVLATAAVIGSASRAEAALYYWSDFDPGYSRPVPTVQPRRQKPRRHPAKKLEAEKESAKPQGPLIIAISIDQQQLRIYDANGIFAETPISTGMKGHPTPMGVFSVIQKHKFHHSNIYSGAPMPFMQRITWSGVAIHAGVLPGYPASHGCIRMPMAFAIKMWNWTKMGARVVVTPGEMTPASFSHPLLATQKVVPQPAAANAPQTDAPSAAKADRAADDATKPAISQARLELRSTVGHDDSARPKVEPSTSTPLREQTHTADASGDMAATTAPITMTDAALSGRAPPREEPAAARPGEIATTDDKPVETKSAENASAEIKAAETGANDEAGNKPDPADSAAQGGVEAKPNEVRTDLSKPDVAKANEKPNDSVKAVADIGATVPVKIDQTRLPDTEKVTAPKPDPATLAAPKRGGQIAVFVSRKDSKLYVRQNFAPLFEVPVTIAPSDRPLGTHVFTAQVDKDDANVLRWSVVSLPAARRQAERRDEDERTSRRRKIAGAVEIKPLPVPDSPAEALDRLTIPADAMARITEALSTGSSIIVSDQGINAGETGEGTDFIVSLR